MLMLSCPCLHLSLVTEYSSPAPLHIHIGVKDGDDIIHLKLCLTITMIYDQYIEIPQSSVFLLTSQEPTRVLR